MPLSRCSPPGSGRSRYNSWNSFMANERGMVRDRKIQTKQADDRADQPFGLPQRQAKHCPQGQSRRDRQCRIGPNERTVLFCSISGQIGFKERTEKELSPEICHSVTAMVRGSASDRKAATRCFRLILWPQDVALPAYVYQRGVSFVLASHGHGYGA